MRFAWLFTLFAACLTAAVPVDLSGYREAADLRVEHSGDILTAHWTGERNGALRLRLNLADAEKLISELSVNGKPLLRDAAPAYFVYTGKRRGGWDNFFDTPSTRPREIAEANSTLAIDRARVHTGGRRMRLRVEGLSLGPFRGALVFTVFAGSNLVQQEAVVSTVEPDVAYYYNAWLTRVSTLDLNRLHWMDAEGRFRRHVLTSDVDLDYVPLKVRRRALIAEGASGSLAVFPPPHQYFFARDETINYANLWYRLYRIHPIAADGEWFSFGIRQTPVSEQARWVPLVNAPPGAEQRMSLFWYAHPGPAREAFDRVSAYTHNDRFPALPGRKTFTSHYHVSMTMEARRHRALGIPYAPEFVDVFRQMGVNIAHLMDFHTDGHPRDTGAVRRDELREYYDISRRLSGPDLLLIPGEEANAHFEGHWNLLLPRPVEWFMRRGPGEAFEHSGVY
ncbi:MAG: hypothetical protein ACRD96_20250, partial [Bryobacteraceae bacterium]